MIQKFLSFDKMITPMIIKVVFWIGIVITVLSGLGTMISGFNSFYGGGLQVFTGLLIIIIGPIVVRIYCELLILMFKIYDTLREIRDNVTVSKRDTIE
ncbi:protein of unknown function [Gracilibacillus ureilyticus]|uniref:DUF4282 domain-containing protein n=1 Tax=Gracilibacillus ureilyticus TaxID=531814 RepID=A0A1H9MKM4_9BACI|nr:DUF4282 domain-containing protein [Gracilibacillus ureilyticus]SER24101.1 protein of unknown function [Gracilibacillus ureilyticus]